MIDHDALAQKRCLPCEGGLPPWTRDASERQLQVLPGWSLTADGRRISRRWAAKHFAVAIEFFRAIADLAEAEQHHPDLHRVSYRQVTIEIWTHAIGGLSENDFILAAKIDRCAAEHQVTSLPPANVAQSD